MDPDSSSCFFCVCRSSVMKAAIIFISDFFMGLSSFAMATELRLKKKSELEIFAAFMTAE